MKKKSGAFVCNVPCIHLHRSRPTMTRMLIYFFGCRYDSGSSWRPPFLFKPAYNMNTSRSRINHCFLVVAIRCVIREEICIKSVHVSIEKIRSDKMRALNQQDSRVSSYKPGNAGHYSRGAKKRELSLVSSADAFKKGEHVLKVERLVGVFEHLMESSQIYAEVLLGAAGSSGQHLRGEQRNNLHTACGDGDRIR
jgi:hypothetical protein